MSEEIWTCPKCESRYLKDNSETYSGIEAVLDMTCSRCRLRTGKLVILENQLGTMLRKEWEDKQRCRKQ